MINDDILIKYSIQRLNEKHFPSSKINNWVDYTRLLLKQIHECMLGFPGIGYGDITIIRPCDVTPNIRIILDDNLDCNCGTMNTDHAPILGIVREKKEEKIIFEIEGIGCGYDFTRDPFRNLQWRDIIEVNINNYQTILRMDSKPRNNGGSVYYYYNKHTRDSRY